MGFLYSSPISRNLTSSIKTIVPILPAMWLCLGVNQCWDFMWKTAISMPVSSRASRKRWWIMARTTFTGLYPSIRRTNTLGLSILKDTAMSWPTTSPWSLESTFWGWRANRSRQNTDAVSTWHQFMGQWRSARQSWVKNSRLFIWRIVFWAKRDWIKKIWYSSTR